MPSPSRHAGPELLAPDERLVAPGSRYEIEDGQLVYVPPADQLHGISHGALGALLRAHRSPDREVALDMLTRTSADTDIAPAASVYPRARDPRTEGRQLEELAFDLLSRHRLPDAARRAAKLSRRGVRRIFAIDVVRQRAFEWSADLETWLLLAPEATITDPALAVSIPVGALFDPARVDDAIAAACLHLDTIAGRAGS